MESLGVNAYRFSISWPRVLPEGIGSPSREESTSTSGSWTACARGIEPVATLYHWDLPQALHELGGWVERDSAGWFVDYAALMFDELGDGVTRWITHNEPFVTSFLGHAYGTKRPGGATGAKRCTSRTNVLPAWQCAHSAASVRAARSGSASTSGAVRSATRRATARRSSGGMPAATAGSSIRCCAVRTRRSSRSGSSRSSALELGPPADLEIVSEPIDFLGVNYYSQAVVGEDRRDGPLQVREQTPTPR